MTEPFIGEVQILGFGYAPYNWATAAGQLLSIRQSSTLYTLYGTTFGGDGVSTFALPNLASRQGCGAGQSPGNSRRSIGQAFGSTGVALSSAETPMHNHVFLDYSPDDASQLAASPVASGAIGYASNTALPFGPIDQATAMDLNAIGIAGNGSPHENRQPFLGLTYAVALVGQFPAFG